MRPDSHFVLRYKSHLINAQTLTDKALPLVVAQHFKSKFDDQVEPITYQIMIALKRAADESRRAGEKVPGAVELLLAVARERESCCTNDTSH